MPRPPACRRSCRAAATAIGAFGAPMLGALHEVTGGWTLGLAMIFAVSLVYCAVLLLATAASWRATR